MCVGQAWEILEVLGLERTSKVSSDGTLGHKLEGCDQSGNDTAEKVDG